MRRLWACLLAIGPLSGCAAASRPRAAEAGAPQVSPAKEEKPAEFERIASSFRVHPEAVVYLTPALVRRHLEDCDQNGALVSLTATLHALGDARAEAGARLNLGALYWCDDRADQAYAELMQAQALFTRAADLDGVARAHEWLGYFFLQSHRPDLAGEHLAAAYQIFSRMGDSGSSERVLSYAE